MAGTKEPIHILMRFADKLFSVEDVIARHQQVIAAHGAVWMGKVGKPLAEKYVAAINRQCREGISTHLYLAQKTKVGYEVYMGEVLAASRETPTEGLLVPSYYEERKILRYITFWVKLSGIQRLDNESVRRLRIASSGTRVPEALATSMAGMFVVRDVSDLPAGF